MSDFKGFTKRIGGTKQRRVDLETVFEETSDSPFTPGAEVEDPDNVSDGGLSQTVSDVLSDDSEQTEETSVRTGSFHEEFISASPMSSETPSPLPRSRSNSRTKRRKSLTNNESYTNPTCIILTSLLWTSCVALFWFSLSFTFILTPRIVNIFSDAPMESTLEQNTRPVYFKDVRDVLKSRGMDPDLETTTVAAARRRTSTWRSTWFKGVYMMKFENVCVDKSEQIHLFQTDGPPGANDPKTFKWISWGPINWDGVEKVYYVKDPTYLSTGPSKPFRTNPNVLMFDVYAKMYMHILKKNPLPVPFTTIFYHNYLNPHIFTLPLKFLWERSVLDLLGIVPLHATQIGNPRFGTDMFCFREIHFPASGLNPGREKSEAENGVFMTSFTEKLRSKLPEYRMKHLAIVYDRSDMKDRIWKNAKWFAKRLQHSLDLEFVYINKDNPWPDPRKQIELWHNATIFVGPHGAHMGNALFMQPGSFVAELSCNNQTYFRSAAKALGHVHLFAEIPLLCPGKAVNANFTLQTSSMDLLVKRVAEYVNPPLQHKSTTKKKVFTKGNSVKKNFTKNGLARNYAMIQKFLNS